MSLFPRLYNKRIDKNIPKDAVLIDRTTFWGNMFKMENENERNMVCDQFENWIKHFPGVIKKAKKDLAGKDLVCWCHPKRCHGETLLRIANEVP